MLILLRRLFTHNWLLKLFSLLLATLMWLAIWSGSNDQMPRTVQLVITNIPDSMEITGETDIPFTLQLRGSFDVLAGLSAADITPAISLAGHEPGPKNFAISPENFRPPPGVEIFDVTPDRIEFNLEYTIRKSVEIQAFVEGDPAEGYTVAVDGVSVTPARMLIEGPESSVAPIGTLTTAPVRIDGRNESLSASVNLDIPDPRVRLESFAPVEVFVEIVEISIEATFEIPPDPALAESWNLDTEILEVTLSGPASTLDSFAPDGLLFTFDPLDVGEDGQVGPTIIGLPEGVSVVSQSPPTILVEPRDE